MKRLGCILPILLLLGIYFALQFYWARIDPRTVALATDCRNDLSEDCLVDVGLYVLGREDDLSIGLREISWLAQMRRYEDAIAINERALASSPGGSNPNDILRSDRRFASYRLIDALYEGQSLEQTLASTPGWEASDIWIAMAEISEQGNSSGLQRIPSPLSGAEIREIVSQAVDVLFRLDDEEKNGLPGYQLLHVADLAAWLRDQERTLEVLSRLPDQSRISYVISQEVFELAGTQTVMATLERVSKLDHYDFRRAGEAEEDPAAAEAYLRRAFALVKEERFLSSRQLIDIFEIAVHKEYEALALEFAREIASLSFISIDSSAHVGVSALITAGAPHEEIDAAIGRVIDGLPELDATYPVYARRYPSTGRAQFAVQLARIGEFEQAAELLNGVGGPFGSWQLLVTPHYGLETMNYFLDQADRRLGENEMLELRTQMVRHVATHDDLPEDLNAWALEMAWEISAMEQIRYDREFEIRDMILIYAIETHNAELETLALERLAQAALSDPTSRQLIRAALEWHVSPNSPDHATD